MISDFSYCKYKDSILQHKGSIKIRIFAKMKLLAFLFWFFVIVYLLGMVARLVLRGLLLRNFGRQSQRPGPKGGARRVRKEGEVTIERLETREKVVDRKVGEYVDYEEVEE